MSSFTTEFGHTIPFVPGYFDRNKGYAYYAKKTDLHHGEKLEGDELSIATPLKDYVQFSAMHQFMRKYGLAKRYGRGVDLGGAESTSMRLFKAAGMVEHATSVDMDDYSNVVSEALFERVVDIGRSPEEAKPWIKLELQIAKEVYGHFDFANLAAGLSTDLPFKPELDSALIMDLLETPGTYDLVTSFCCFDYLEINKALTKVRELLAPGGVFVAVLEYWWWPVNSTGIVGHFPYAGARLSFDDLIKYYTRNHRDLLDNLFTKYNYFHEGMQHPTIDDWFDLAKANGLRPLAVERIIPRRHRRLPECPPTLFAQPWFDHREVLRDAQLLNPKVVVEDLFTSAIKIAMTRA